MDGAARGRRYRAARAATRRPRRQVPHSRGSGARRARAFARDVRSGEPAERRSHRTVACAVSVSRHAAAARGASAGTGRDEPGSAGMNAGGAPLAGVRIADFTIHAAGPFGTQLLAQLGAECIKIESRTRPDAFRKPHAVYGRMTAATFDQVSVNKLSVRLNLKQPEAVQLAKRLVSISDVAAESFRAGVMKRLGLGFDDLRAVKPDIVLLSLSSCGQSGPDAHFAGYAPLFGAWGGLGWMTGYADGPPVEMRHVM